MTPSLEPKPVNALSAGLARAVHTAPGPLTLGGWLKWLLPCLWLGCLVGSPAALAADGVLSPGDSFQDCSDCPHMVVVPAGSFVMGSPLSERKRYEDEGPQHRVRIAKPFAVGVYEVTFDEWDACEQDFGCGNFGDDAGWGRGRRPVINVSWNDAQEYVGWLSDRTGKAYRLLSESEWEYVARAGTTGPYHYGAGISLDQANFDGLSGQRNRTVPVGSFPANRFGLHDVHGNVMEWVQDCAHENYDGAPRDGSAWESGDCKHRISRGGGWDSSSAWIRSAFRGRWWVAGWPSTGTRINSPDVGVHFRGFRVARTITP